MPSEEEIEDRDDDEEKLASANLGVKDSKFPNDQTNDQSNRTEDDTEKEEEKIK